TDSGKVFQTPVYEIPEGTRVARGRGLMNFLEVSSNEKVLSLISLPKVKPEEQNNVKYLVMITKNGRIKKTALEAFENVRKTGIRMKKVNEVFGIDVISKLVQSDGKKTKQYLLVVMENGYGKRTDVNQYKVQGRGGSGIKTANITTKTGPIVISDVLTDSAED